MALSALAIAQHGIGGASPLVASQGFIGDSTPTPTPTPTQGFAGGYLSRRHLRIWQEEKKKRRTADLMPVAAEAKAARKVAKAEKIPKLEAEDLVQAAVNYLSQDPAMARIAEIAKAKDAITDREAAEVRAFWLAVAEYAAEIAEEEDLMVLLL